MWQAQIHPGFAGFTKIGQIFHNKYIFVKEKQLSKLQGVIRVELNWPISRLNGAETQER